MFKVEAIRRKSWSDGFPVSVTTLWGQERH